MTICQNCDAGPAVWRCTRCPDDLARLCGLCAELHQRTKALREHPLESIPTQSEELCRNCEQALSKVVCTICDENHKYLCLGCSVMHPKIKQFRGHHVTPIDFDCRSPGFQPSSNSLLSQFCSFCETQMDNVLALSWWSPRGFISAVSLVFMVVAYFVVTKRLCGPFQPVVHFLVLIGIIRSARPGLFQRDNGAAIAHLHAKSLDPPQLVSDEFSDEFPYATQSSRPSVLGKGLRPRTRPYQPRLRRPASS